MDNKERIKYFTKHGLTATGEAGDGGNDGLIDGVSDGIRVELKKKQTLTLYESTHFPELFDELSDFSNKYIMGYDPIDENFVADRKDFIKEYSQKNFSECVKSLAENFFKDIYLVDENLDSDLELEDGEAQGAPNHYKVQSKSFVGFIPKQALNKAFTEAINEHIKELEDEK